MIEELDDKGNPVDETPTPAMLKKYEKMLK